MNQIIQIKTGLLSKAIVWVLGVILFITPLLWSGDARAQQKNFTADIIQVVVDEDICAAVISPCTTLGFGGIPAAFNNASPVALAVQLIDPRGNPITGLVQSDFAMNFDLIGGVDIDLPFVVAALLNANIATLMRTAALISAEENREIRSVNNISKLFFHLLSTSTLRIWPLRTVMG